MSAEILIVDDNADIRNIINELIIDAGYKTRIAANYSQALTEIDKKLPDVAILDVKLDKGDNDGIELLSHIKMKDKDVPVIIISGHANMEMAIKSLHHGAFEFIEKPFDQDRLLNFVSRAVENYNLKKQNREYESKLFSSYEIIGDSKNTINILLSLFVVTLLTNCTTLERPKPTGHLIKDQTFVQQTAGQSFIRMTDKNGTAIHTCTMPQPDATFSVTTEEGLGLAIGSEEATMGSSEAEMVGRTPTVLMSRELFFRTCEFAVNYNLSKKEATDLFNKTLDTVISLATIQANNTTVTVGDTVATATTNTDGVTSTTTTAVTADNDTDDDDDDTDDDSDS